MSAKNQKTTPNMQKLGALVRPKANAVSVRILDTAGRLYESRALQFTKAVDELKMPTESGDQTIAKGGAKVYAHPFPMKTLSMALACSPYHYTACRTKSDYIGGSSYVINDRNETKAMHAIKLWSKKFLKYFKKENTQIVDWIEHLGYQDYIINIIAAGAFNYEAFGNAYFEIMRDVMGRIAYVRVRPSVNMWKKVGGGFVEWKRDPNTGSFGYIHYADFASKDNPNKLNEIFHIKKTHPYSEAYGVSDIVHAWTAVSKASLIDEYNEKFFGNNAVPQYAVILEGGTWAKGKDAEIADHLKQHHKGEPHKTLVLSAGGNAKIRFEPLSVNIKDGSFSLLKQECYAEILTVHRVPPAKAGIIKTGALAGESTQEQLDDFENSIARSQGQFADMMDMLIRDRWAAENYEYKVLGVGSRLTRDQIETDNLDQVLSINEKRKNRGLDRYESDLADVPQALIQFELGFGQDVGPVTNTDPVSNAA